MKWTSVKIALPPAEHRVIATNGEITGEAYIVTVGGVSKWHRAYNVLWESWAREPVTAWMDMPDGRKVNMKLIDKDELMKRLACLQIVRGIEDRRHNIFARETMLQFIDEVRKSPVVEDVVPIKRGRWGKFGYCFSTSYREMAVCSVCGRESPVALYDKNKNVAFNKPDFRYCPFCGAKMEVNDD